MKRSATFDPPEYLHWEPDADLVARFRSRIEEDEERRERVSALTRQDLVDMYAHLLRTRLVDTGLKRWVRQGVISKAWLGTGEEAVTVGSVLALDRSRDVVSPMIRNAGAGPMMGMSVSSVFQGYLATRDAPNGGRDLHIGDPSVGVIQPISHMGTNVPVMAGVALAARYLGEDRVAMTWIGDGATKSGECHEGLTLAVQQALPVVFVLQNNQVALGTRATTHGAGDLDAWPALYGMPGWRADGNHVLDVYAATRLAVERCRRGEGPAMVVAHTFRMGGHATHDEREARQAFPAALFEEWGRRDPVGLFEVWLEESGIPRSDLEAVEDAVSAEVDAAAEEALESRGRDPEPAFALYNGISEGGTLRSMELRPVKVVQTVDRVRHS